MYVSFSGGKDSTVLLHLVRSIYPDVPAVFCDTGLEYPGIRNFVKTIPNVTWIKPKMSFLQVLQKYGYPMVSKEVARDVAVAKHKPNGKTAEKFDKNSDFCKKYGEQWSMARYKYLIDADFDITNRCCGIMKKEPFHKYDKDNGVHPYIGTQTQESRLRRRTWLNQGCNAFDNENPQSAPLSFWTEQDILRYIKNKKLNVSSVYGELIEKDGRLKFTQIARTGCVFCGFGAQCEHGKRYTNLKNIEPKLYNYCMRGGKYDENGKWIPDKGLGMAHVLDYIGIPYEPYEENKE